MLSIGECTGLSGRRRCDRRTGESSHLAPAPNLFLEGNLGPIEDAAPPAFIDRGSVGGSGPSSPLLFGNANHFSKPPLVLGSVKRALQRLVSRDVPHDELPSVIETVISNVKAVDIVECLQGNDAQTFIDVLDEACHRANPSLRNLFTHFCSDLLVSVGQALDNVNLAPLIRKKCVKSLYKMCAGHTLLPKSLHFELDGDLVGVPLYRGGFGHVWKREYRGREVAVKVLQAHRHGGSRDITKVSDRWAEISLCAG